MAIQFFVIFGCLALGEFVVWATGIKLPSSIIGMLFLTFFLKVGWVTVVDREAFTAPHSQSGLLLCATGGGFDSLFGCYSA